MISPSPKKPKLSFLSMKALKNGNRISTHKIVSERAKKTHQEFVEAYKEGRL